MLGTLITSKTRIKILIKFFLNCNSSSHLRGLETEFGESSNAIRMELNRFEKAGLLLSKSIGNKKLFRANTEHPLYKDIHNILIKYVGFDMIIDKVIKKIGEIDSVYVVGDFAQGKDSKIIDLIVVGEEIDKNFLFNLVSKAENIINKRIRFLVYNRDEISEHLRDYSEDEILTLWEN